MSPSRAHSATAMPPLHPLPSHTQHHGARVVHERMRGSFPPVRSYSLNGRSHSPNDRPSPRGAHQGASTGDGGRFDDRSDGLGCNDALKYSTTSRHARAYEGPSPSNLRDGCAGSAPGEEWGAGYTEGGRSRQGGREGASLTASPERSKAHQLNSLELATGHGGGGAHIKPLRLHPSAVSSAATSPTKKHAQPLLHQHQHQHHRSSSSAHTTTAPAPTPLLPQYRRCDDLAKAPDQRRNNIEHAPPGTHSQEAVVGPQPHFSLLPEALRHSLKFQDNAPPPPVSRSALPFPHTHIHSTLANTLPPSSSSFPSSHRSSSDGDAPLPPSFLSGFASSHAGSGSALPPPLRKSLTSVHYNFA